MDACSVSTYPYTPLPTALARSHCLHLQDQLERYKALDFEGDGVVSTAPLFVLNGGQMFGVLVCRDCEGREVVLKAFSGQYQGRWLVPGWVPPVPDPAEYAAVLEKNDRRIHQLTALLEQLPPSSAEALVFQRERSTLTDESQRGIFGLYTFCCHDGTRKPLVSLFNGLPPSGTGDCCAPKLLHQAFSLGLLPVSMAEFYFGSPNRSGTKQHRMLYPPCDDRCRPLLKHLLGLDILYCDEHIAVVNKPSGLLSVPGRGADKQDCVETRLRSLFPDCIQQPAVHRLDMDTSGLLLLAFDAQSHRNLSMQFMQGAVQKQYVALLNGVLKESEGTIELPFRLDVEHRPRQIYDAQQGKVGVTKWRRIGVETLPSGDLVTRVMFTPLTGRTHQLRVHSAHEKGLAHAIVGDRLYGEVPPEPGQRLMLHSCLLSFHHPLTDEAITMRCDPDF